MANNGHYDLLRPRVQLLPHDCPGLRAFQGLSNGILQSGVVHIYGGLGG